MKKDQKAPLIKVKQSPSTAGKLEYEIVSNKRINLTKKRAEQFLEMDTFEGERQVSDVHVQKLYDAWRDGQFMWEHVIIGVCMVGERTYRVNGQHTNWMRLNIPDEDINAMVTEVVYRVEDEHALRRLYCTFDNNKSRSQGHQFNTIVTGTKMTEGISRSALGVLCSGLRLWLYPIEQSRTNRGKTAIDLAAMAMEKYNDLFTRVGHVYEKYRNEFVPIKRASTIAAMFATYDALPTKADEFWEPVFNGLGFQNAKDARLQLRKFMETHGHASRQGTISISQEDGYRIGVQAWNRWRKNEPVSNLRSTETRVKAI